MTSWNANDIPDLTGRTAVITGANSGLGIATTEALAAKGAHVVLAVRDTEKGRRAAASVSGSTEVRSLDLADLSSVRAFSEGWDRPIDLLINNAGVMVIPQSQTADGFERQFGTNHLGHFALTNSLLPHVTGRVVTVASTMHQMVDKIKFDNVNSEGDYHRWRVYAQSKLANLLFTLELERRLEAAGSPARALAAHPGWAATNLQGNSGNVVLNAALWLGTKLMAQDYRAGSRPTLYAATQDLPGGSYVGPDKFGGLRGAPTLVGRSAAASDVEAGRKLWALSEEMTGVSWPSTVSS